VFVCPFILKSITGRSVNLVHLALERIVLLECFFFLDAAQLFGCRNLLGIEGLHTHLMDPVNDLVLLLRRELLE
jgi:hypothetical protein